MKFGKDEIQKIALSSIVLLASLYAYFNLMLGPLAKGEVATKDALAKLEKQIADGKRQLQQAQTLETSSLPSGEKIKRLKDSIPDGAPVAWFPPQIGAFFKQHGIEKIAVRLNNEVADKDLPGFRKLFWTIDVPKVEFVPLGLAIAALENEHPLLEITNLGIEQSKDNVQFQHATLTVSTIVKN